VDVLTSTILPFLLIIVVLVVVHEFGHFITAKMFNVKVLEFGVGFPPRLFAFKRGETEYTVNALPLGGFVRLLGEEDDSDPRSLLAQPPWKRLIIMGAGAFMNFVLAIFLFSLALMIPREVSVGNAVISQVVPGSPADMAGLQTGDIIEEIGGRKIESVPDASYNINLNLGEDTEVVVRRTDPSTGETTVESVHVVPRWAPPPYEYVVQPGDDVATVADATGFDRDIVRQAAGIDYVLEPDQLLILGTGEEAIHYTTKEGDTVGFVARVLRVSDAEVARAAGLPDPDTLQPGATLLFTQGATGIRIAPQYPFTEMRSDGPFTALEKGWQRTWDSLKLARNGIYSWIKGGSSAPVTGPIGIAQATGEIVREAGWKSLMETAALLSMNLAVLNILPLPFVDGGKIVFVLIEMARRGKRIAPQKENLVHLAGLVALVIMVVALSYFDIARIVRGDDLLR
jgi:regulator of sigma E protease